MIAIRNSFPVFILLSGVLFGQAPSSGDEMDRIAGLTGPAQQAELRALLTRELKAGTSDRIFFHEHRLRPALFALTEDPYVGPTARSVLAFIGVPADLG